MKRLTNYLFFLDSEGNLERVVPLKKGAYSKESEVFVSELFKELFKTQIQIQYFFLKIQLEYGPALFNITLGETKLVMEFQSLSYTDETKPGQVVSFIERDNNAPQTYPSKRSLEFEKIADIDELSHEIKNSVNLIQGISELMKEAPESSSLQLIPKLDSSVKYLKSLVVSYLVHEKNKTQRWAKTNFNLKQEIQELIEQVSFLNKSEKLRFEVKLDNEIPEKIKGNSVALRQVLINLLFNALQHSDSGLIKLRIIFQHETAQVLRLRFDVEDAGKGFVVPGSEAMSLFENSNFNFPPSKNGFGLGLKICRKILTKMGSKLRMKSSPGKGTIFSFDLDFQKIENNYSEDDLNFATLKNTNDLKAKKALIVDDDPINRIMVSKCLTQMGIEHEEAGDGISAIQRLHEVQFDVLLLDVHLPYLDGISILNILRPRFSNLKIILTSGSSQFPAYLKTSQFEEVGILEKPYSNSELANILKNKLH